MPDAKGKQLVQLRLDPEVYDKLKIMSKREQRSMTNWLTHHITEEYLKKIARNGKTEE